MRGGRSHGHRHHHHHRGGRSGPSYETIIDTLANAMPVPIVANGTYTHTANQLTVCTQLEGLSTQAQTMVQNGSNITSLDLTIVGTKVDAGSGACVCLTMVFACLIFPLFFMCCGWWKRIAHPKYEVDVRTYQAVINGVSSVQTINNLNLTVVDSAFDG